MSGRLKIAFIYQEDEPLNREILPRWAADFAEVVGELAISERKNVQRRRIRAELRRVGFWRLLDVLAFRIYYRLFLAKQDYDWELRELASLRERWPEPSIPVPKLTISDPNLPQAAEFLQKCAPDLIIARCKWILRRDIYSIPTYGTFVLHPGICPEYRNSHGCFWALANRDLKKVGLTLLKIDDGIDTGPVYDYFTYGFDECTESHIRIQNRMFTENLATIRRSLEEIAAGRKKSLDTRGRPSKNWGQPWLTRYFSWKRAARSAR